MAEGLLNTFHGDRYEAYSAGLEPTRINPYAVKVMQEIGIDISTHRSKNIKEFRGKRFDIVVTVCDQAKEACPFFPGKKVLHKGFKDPTKFTGTEDEISGQVRHLRDEMRDWIDRTFGL
jgi:arsenate reductase